jgi:hypothetical protein
VSGIWSILIDEKREGPCRAHDVVTGRSWWRSRYDECLEIIEALDKERWPGFGVLTEKPKKTRTKRKAKEDPTPWMDPERGL